MSAIEGNTSRIRCASTVPMSAGHRPGRFRSGIRRISTPMRATSPTRPGSTPLAKIPTKKAEKTSTQAGMRLCDRLVDHVVPRHRPRETRDEVEEDRGAGPAPAHARERVPDLRPVRAMEHEEGDEPGPGDGDEPEVEKRRAAKAHSPELQFVCFPSTICPTRLCGVPGTVSENVLGPGELEDRHLIRPARDAARALQAPVRVVVLAEEVPPGAEDRPLVTVWPNAVTTGSPGPVRSGVALGSS